MNKMIRNIIAGGGVGTLFLLQIIGASGTMNFLFFPAASLYIATYMTAPLAFVLGVFVGSIWDSISLAPFGAYALGLGGGMGGASLYMRFVDERNMAAHSFVAFFFWGIFTSVFGILYFVLGKGMQVITLHGYDSLIGFFVLAVLAGCHMGLRKLYRRA